MGFSSCPIWLASLASIGLDLGNALSKIMRSVSWSADAFIDNSAIYMDLQVTAAAQDAENARSHVIEAKQLLKDYGLSTSQPVRVRG